MDVAANPLLDELLTDGLVVALRVAPDGAIAAIHHAALLDAWLQETAGGTAPVTALPTLLPRLFAESAARRLLQELEAAQADAAARVRSGPLPLHVTRTASARHLELSLQPADAASGDLRWLTLRDVSRQAEVAEALAEARAQLDTALAALRARPDVLRLFLESAMASVSALRATLRLPARTQEAVRDKLQRLQQGASTLATEADDAQLPPVAAACRALAQQAATRLGLDPISGDALLPLAPAIDHIAGCIGRAWRIESQRHLEPAPAAAQAPRRRRRSGGSTDWARTSERRWNDFLRRRGEEIGTLARLTMVDAGLVPPALRRQVDEMLQHLLRNALEHGIETPEQRLAADKPATGQVTVRFEHRGAAGLRISVRDDGRGIDVERIGRAAVKCGLLSEESLVGRQAVDVVGLIFKPAFTTEGLDGEAGHGRGMSYLRKAITRLNGQISVATKPGRYTQFVIQLPPLSAARDTAHDAEPAPDAIAPDEAPAASLDNG